MEFFAIAEARRSGQMYMPRRSRWTREKDGSELLHTNDSDIRKQQELDFLRFMEGGYPAIEEPEDEE